MPCSFQLQIPAGNSATELFVSASAGIKAQGGRLTGSASRGSAVVPSPVGDISLNYDVVGSVVTVTVTDKPFLAGCSQIKDEFTKYLPSAKKTVIDSSGQTITEAPWWETGAEPPSGSASASGSSNQKSVKEEPPTVVGYNKRWWAWMAGAVLFAIGVRHAFTRR
jgi:hypothetical protein